MGRAIVDISFPFLELSIAQLLRLKGHSRKRLCGYWSGTFEPTPNIDHQKLVTHLIVGEAQGKIIHAVIYYEGHKNGQIIYKGTDEIIDGADMWFNYKERVWTPKFTNKVHLILNKTPTNLDYDPPDDYLWQCNLDSNWRHMEVVVHKVGQTNITFTGHLNKR
jgi:hypothetical protein